MQRKKEKKSKSKLGLILQFHLFLMVSSVFGIASKLAAGEKMFSFRFFFFYAVVLLNLGVYAIVWQQLIKRMSLTTAYASKAVSIIWGVIWGCLFFKEMISFRQIVAILVIIAGVILVVTDKEEQYD